VVEVLEVWLVVAVLVEFYMKQPPIYMQAP
jgi:hypothetical protein